MHTTAWRTDLENVIGNERSQTQKATCYMIPFIWHVQDRQIHRDQKSKLVVARVWRQRGEHSDYLLGPGFLWGGENVLDPESCTTL